MWIWQERTAATLSPACFVSVCVWCQKCCLGFIVLNHDWSWCLSPKMSWLFGFGQIFLIFILWPLYMLFCFGFVSVVFSPLFAEVCLAPSTNMSFSWKQLHFAWTKLTFAFCLGWVYSQTCFDATLIWGQLWDIYVICGCIYILLTKNNSMCIFYFS